jgi:hypothetical protein
LEGEVHDRENLGDSIIEVMSDNIALVMNQFAKLPWALNARRFQ